MRKEFLAHKLAYSILIIGLSIGILSFMAVWPDRLLQRMVILSITVFYFAWGVTTHLKSKHITGGVILEYFLVSLLAGSLMMLVTL